MDMMNPMQSLGAQPQQSPQGQINPQTGQPFTEAEMAQMAAMLGTYGDKLDLENLTSQQDLANALRTTQMPEARSNGRVTTAANPLELAGTLMQQYAGKRMNDRIERQGGKLRDRIGQNVQEYGKLALRGPGDPLARTSPPEALTPGGPGKLNLRY